MRAIASPPLYEIREAMAPDFLTSAAHIGAYARLAATTLESGCRTAPLFVLGTYWEGLARTLLMRLGMSTAPPVQLRGFSSGPHRVRYLTQLLQAYHKDYGTVPSQFDVLGSRSVGRQLDGQHIDEKSNNPLLLVLQPELTPVAAYFAAASGAVLIGGSFDDLDEILERTSARSLAFFALTTALSRRTQLAVHVKLERLAAILGRRRIPHGWFAGPDTASIAWQIAKTLIYRNLRDRRQLVLLPTINEQHSWTSDQSTTIACGSDCEPILLSSVVSDPRGSVSIFSHGDEADAYLRGALLCSRHDERQTSALATTRGERLIRCMASGECYKMRSTKHFSGSSPQTLIRASDTLAKVFFVNTCSRPIFGGDGRYIEEASLSRAATLGMCGALVLPERTRGANPFENILLDLQLAAGASIGDAVLTLNEAQDRHFDGTVAFSLFGDPEMRLDEAASPGGPSTSPVEQTEKGFRVVIPPHAPPVIALSNSAADGGPLLQDLDISVYDEEGQVIDPAFFVQTSWQDSPYDVWTLVRPDALDRHVEVRLESARSAPFLSEWELARIVERAYWLQTLRATEWPSGALVGELEENVRNYRRVLTWPAARTNRSALLRKLERAIETTTIEMQEALIQHALEACRTHPGGFLCMTKDEYLLTQPARSVVLHCDACGGDLCEQVMKHALLPSFSRTLSFCYRCGLIEERDPIKSSCRLQMSSAVSQGSSLEVTIEIEAASHRPEPVVVAGVVLGAADRATTAERRFIHPGHGAQVHQLRLGISSDCGPGVYYLKILLVQGLLTTCINRSFSVIVANDSDT